MLAGIERTKMPTRQLNIPPSSPSQSPPTAQSCSKGSEKNKKLHSPEIFLQFQLTSTNGDLMDASDVKALAPSENVKEFQAHVAVEQCREQSIDMEDDQSQALPVDEYEDYDMLFKSHAVSPTNENIHNIAEGAQQSRQKGGRFEGETQQHNSPRQRRKGKTKAKELENIQGPEIFLQFQVTSVSSGELMDASEVPALDHTDKNKKSKEFYHAHVAVEQCGTVDIPKSPSMDSDEETYLGCNTPLYHPGVSDVPPEPHCHDDTISPASEHANTDSQNESSHQLPASKPLSRSTDAAMGYSHSKPETELGSARRHKRNCYRRHSIDDILSPVSISISSDEIVRSERPKVQRAKSLTSLNRRKAKTVLSKGSYTKNEKGKYVTTLIDPVEGSATTTGEDTSRERSSSKKRIHRRRSGRAKDSMLSLSSHHKRDVNSSCSSHSSNSMLESSTKRRASTSEAQEPTSSAASSSHSRGDESRSNQSTSTSRLLQSPSRRRRSAASDKYLSVFSGSTMSPKGENRSQRKSRTLPIDDVQHSPVPSRRRSSSSSISKSSHIPRSRSRRRSSASSASSPAKQQLLAREVLNILGIDSIGIDSIDLDDDYD